MNTANGDTGVEWEVPVDANNKCVEFNPFKGGIHCGRKRKTNPHMRAFWGATLAFTFAFVGWFAFAPLLPVVRVDIGICDNQDAIMLLPESERVKECICKKSCKKSIGNANIAAVSFDVATRFLLGSVIEQFGPRMTDCILLSIGAVVVGCSAAVVNETGLIIARFFVSCLGSTFVVNQFWNSIMFNKAVVGTANATAGGWGNLGGGLTQIIMPLVNRFWYNVVGLNLSAAWRVSMFFPVLLYCTLTPWIYCCTQDTPTGKFDVAILGKAKKAGFMDYVRCCTDYRVFLMIFQYSACFGCELVMNNILATHFYDEFGVDLVAAGALALSFGAMNLFARSLGGIASDWANKRWQMKGRLWAHFLSLFGQAVFLFLFGCIDKNTGGWPAALAVLVVFATFVNMAEGTSYGIVPYMIPQELAVVSAVVGAGGTLGAVIATWAFYKNFDTLTSLKLHSAYVLFWALTCFVMKWDHLGSMFAVPDVPAQQKEEQNVEQKEEQKEEVAVKNEEVAVEVSA
jgi:NNP family nitrate/nitrite transporter-like MFS transporter